MKARFGIILQSLILLMMPFVCNGQDARKTLAESRTSIGCYEGRAMENNFGDLFTSPWRPKESWIRTLFVSYKLDGQIRALTFETEGQLVKHRGIQDHWEVNGLLAVRLRPVQAIQAASIATGHGLSYATDTATLDRESSEVPPRLLYYFYAEMAWDMDTIPRKPRLIFRVHHRSGVFGMYCGQNCGSNIPALGFRLSL